MRAMILVAAICWARTFISPVSSVLDLVWNILALFVVLVLCNAYTKSNKDSK